MNFATGDAIKWGWGAFKENIGMLIVVFLIGMVVSGIPSGLQALVQEHGNEFLTIPVQLVSMIVNILLGIIWLRIGLDIYDKGVFKVEEIFRDLDQFGNYLLLSLVMGIAILIGFILLIVPGIILSLMWLFAAALVVDKKMPAMDAMRRSNELTTGYKGDLFVVMLLLGLFSMLGFAACFIGIFITGPVAGLAFVYVYRQFVPADELETVDKMLAGIPPKPSTDHSDKNDRFSPPQF